MKFFNLDRIDSKKKTEENSQNIEMQEDQKYNVEQLDEQILEEAKKLEVNIEEIRREIESFGGPEKFKEYYEKSGGPDAWFHNIAYKQIKDLSTESIISKNKSKWEAYGTAGTLVFITLIHLMVDGSNIAPTTEFGTSIYVVLNIVWARTALKQLVDSIKHRIESRQADRAREVEELKFKMTGTVPE